MVKRLRLASGLVLLVFVATHLANHALGLISLEALEAGRHWFITAWRNPVSQVVLYSSWIGHVALVLWSFYQRRHVALRTGEIIQIFLGLAIPLLLLPHIIGTRGANLLFGTNDAYILVLLVQWKVDPINIGLQTAGTIAAWGHGCLGLHYWLRLRSWYEPVFPYLYAAFLIVPLVSLLGYAEAGRDIVELAQSRDWVREQLAVHGAPNNAQLSELVGILEWTRDIFIGLVVLTVAARLARRVTEHLRGTVRVSYPGGRTVASPPGSTILEISRRAGIPHASVCGGRGRCSTCRVRVTEGFETLPPVSADEQRVLDRVGSPMHVRLACQTRPTTDISIIPLLPPNASPREASREVGHLQGRESEVAVLFADLRSFTQFSERKLPYDVVFVLNRYFANMGEAVEEAGGHLDKFIGDGVMALFGIDEDPARGCRKALEAAKAMTERLADLNQSLASDLDEPLRIGIGIHYGPAIVGEMGYGPAVGVTAVGDTVNTASRLEAATKEYGAQLVVSQAVADAAGIDLSPYPSHDIALRGRSETVSARIIQDAGDLMLNTAPSGSAGAEASG